MASAPVFQVTENRAAAVLKSGMSAAADNLTIVPANGDLASNIRSFARHLRAANLSPKTRKVHIEATSPLASFLVESGMPADVARVEVAGEHGRRNIEPSLAVGLVA